MKIIGEWLKEPGDIFTRLTTRLEEYSEKKVHLPKGACTHFTGPAKCARYLVVVLAFFPARGIWACHGRNHACIRPHFLTSSLGSVPFSLSGDMLATVARLGLAVECVYKDKVYTWGWRRGRVEYVLFLSEEIKNGRERPTRSGRARDWRGASQERENVNGSVC